MRILAGKINNVILYLKNKEAIKLRDALNQIITEEDFAMHVHMSEETYPRKITVLL